MKHRELGKTGFEASVIGLGCAQLGSSNTEYAINVVRKALEFGVNYYDTARGYWDSEIKWAQESGFESYPVFTRKASTDLSYLASVRYVLANDAFFYPQFATHNAHTIA